MKHDFKVETMTAKDAAEILHTSAPKITAAIKNGTLPIGFVADGENRKGGETTRTIVIKRRLEAYINADDLHYRDCDAG